MHLGHAVGADVDKVMRVAVAERFLYPVQFERLTQQMT